MKTSKSLRFLLPILALGTLAAGRTPAQEVAPVPAPTIITSAPYTITTGGYYQLGANLSYAGNGADNDAIITVNASNVTLDLGGHYLSGPVNTPATKVFGVFAYERSNLTIKNGTISHCLIGVALAGINQSNSLNINHSLHDLLITNGYYAGAILQGATDSRASANRVSNIGGSTVPSALFGTSTFHPSGAAIGLYMAGGAGNTASNNTVANLTASSSNAGIFGAGSKGFVASGNTISKLAATSYGLYLVDFAVNNTVSNCTYGVSATKYANNLTSDCGTPFTGGTAEGYNN